MTDIGVPDPLENGIDVIPAIEPVPRPVGVPAPAASQLEPERGAA